MALAYNSATGQLEETSDVEAEARARARATFAASQAPAGDLSVLRGTGTGQGVNQMGPLMPVVAPPPEAPIPETEDQRIARRTAEVAAFVDGPDPDKAAPPPAPAAAPAQPVRRVEGGTTTTSRTKIDKLEQKGLDLETEATKKEAGVAERTGKVLEQKAQTEVASATRDASLAEGQAAAQSLAKDHWNAKIAEDEQKYNAAVAERSKMKIEEYGAGDPTWKKVARAMAMAMGEVGAALTKSSRNPAREIIDSQIREHHMLQRQRLEEGDKKVATARQGITDRKQSKAEALIDLERESAANNRAMAAQAKIDAAKVGTEHAKVLAEQLAIDAQKREAEHIQKIGQLRRVQVQSTTQWSNTTGPGVGGATAGGNPTEKQTTLAILAQQMRGDLDTIRKNPVLSDRVLQRMQANQLATEAADKSASGGLLNAAGVALGRAAKIIPRSKYEDLSAKEQMVANAWDNAMEKQVRLLTGAGMPADEARRMALQNMPQPGESPLVHAQKFSRMDAFTEQAMSLSGKAGAMIAAPAPAAGGQGGGLPPEAVPGTLNGKRGYALGGKFYPLEGP